MKMKNKGFTLIELIVVIAIMGTVFTTIYSVLNSGNLLYNNGMKIENVETNGRRVMELLSQKVKTSKNYEQTLNMSIARFNNLKWKDGTIITFDNRVAYIEDYDNNRYLFALKSVNGRKELHQITFSKQGRQKYKISNPLIKEIITPKDEQAYNLDSQNEVKYITGDLKDTELQKLPSGYTPICFLYENYGEQCYLWAESASDKVKINLDEVENDDFTIESDSIIADYIDSVNVENQGSSAKIYIKIKDRNKTKEITTNVFILNSKD